MTNPQDPAANGDDGDAAGFSENAMRIGDTERTSALDALGEHLTAGRITLDEYGERSARITVAKTAGELATLFDDLPNPHPIAPAAGAAAAARFTDAAPIGVPARNSATEAADRRSRAQKIVAATASASVFVALALFFITGSWLWFLLIPAISGIAQAVWGADWREPDHRRPRALGDGRDRQ